MQQRVNWLFYHSKYVKFYWLPIPLFFSEISFACLARSLFIPIVFIQDARNNYRRSSDSGTVEKPKLTILITVPVLLFTRKQYGSGEDWFGHEKYQWETMVTIYNTKERVAVKTHPATGLMELPLSSKAYEIISKLMKLWHDTLNYKIKTLFKLFCSLWVF